MIKILKFINLKAILVYSLFAVFVGCKDASSYKDLNSYEKLEIYYKETLLQSATALDSLVNSKTIKERKAYFLKARMCFKKAEPILAFVDSENYNYLNQPNILKIEEEDFTDVKIIKPTGFQVLEEAVFSDDENDVALINRHALNTSAKLKFLHENASLRFFKKHHILWIIRDAINRVALTGITGFDSPALENSLAESQEVYKSLVVILQLFEKDFKDHTLFMEWKEELDLSINDLKGNFNAFNRYSFIKTHTHKGLEIWNKTVLDWKVVFPFKQAINYEVSNLFGKETFNISYFTGQNGDPLAAEKVALGKLLFEDKSLSKNNNMSCASCHKAEHYFTDGLAKPVGGQRNSPTLFYAALQKGFFHDKRAGSLEAQIVDVINNPNEFHLNLNEVEKKVSTNAKYQMAFSKVYQEKVSNDIIRNAIASYIMSLNPFNSKFDRNIGNMENSLTQDEINGFNLFMGKAKCATCHFAPVFNGLVPTTFKESEIELIGVPSTKDTINPKIDADFGRYDVYKTELRKFFFKTPTIRNIEKTGPYMHNGVYETLEEVVDFYNGGGGNGMGFNLPNQTLPEDKLNLTPLEKKQLIAFMKTLTDTKGSY
ncbi:cytochrome-c peroxidase [Flavobacterium laiguense]|uniref:Methylamine utilization protein n=1 Tax=Flavobacterium laiguense TaxID=2169409 RepID=A0A2U1JNA3_9FLAO|nr:cytochrome c peroxidase [Flavobacterium laiguense]PWA06647.1 methylamine utilization protein [Flavobacterium laiguense]